MTPFSNPFGGSDDSIFGGGGGGSGGLLFQHSFNPFLGQSFYPHFGDFHDEFTGIRRPTQFNHWWNG